MTDLSTLDLSKLTTRELTALIRERIDENSIPVAALLREIAERDPLEWWSEFGTVKRLMLLSASTIEGLYEELQWTD